MYFQVCSNSTYPQHSGERYRTNGPLVYVCLPMRQSCECIYTARRKVCHKSDSVIDHVNHVGHVIFRGLHYGSPSKENKKNSSNRKKSCNCPIKNLMVLPKNNVSKRYRHDGKQ